MSNENWQQYAIVPKSLDPVTTLYESTPEDALVAFATGMDTDMSLYFKAVPVCIERDSQPAAPKAEESPQMARWKKKALCLSADEFDDICVELYGPEIVTHYNMDGFWLEINEDETTSDLDARLIEDLTKYLGLNVTSVRIDDGNNVGVWIVYKEG